MKIKTAILLLAVLLIPTYLRVLTKREIILIPASLKHRQVI